ncbi:MAG: Rid family detoxifying hydrolase [Saprospiraceae bacterium]|nr:Rid family detoxifying hydrolase [Saprospiraceae bacterium]
MGKKIIKTDLAPAPVGPYNQATQWGDLLFISGQIAIVPADNSILQGTIEEETHQVLKNIGAILQQAGMDYTDVLKCSVFVKDMHLFGRINAVYAQYFAEVTAPARELVQVAELPKFVNIEISAIAAKKAS